MLSPLTLGQSHQNSYKDEDLAPLLESFPCRQTNHSAGDSYNWQSKCLTFWAWLQVSVVITPPCCNFGMSICSGKGMEWELPGNRFFMTSCNLISLCLRDSIFASIVTWLGTASSREKQVMRLCYRFYYAIYLHLGCLVFHENTRQYDNRINVSTLSKDTNNQCSKWYLAPCRGIGP